MPQDLAGLVESAYDALNRRDLEAFVALSDPEVEVVSLIAESEGGTYRGHEGVREWWRDVAGSLGGIQFEAEEIRELDDKTLLVRVRTAGEVADVPVEQVMWQAIAIRDGLALWWQPFRSEQEALEGLEAWRSR